MLALADANAELPVRHIREHSGGFGSVKSFALTAMLFRSLLMLFSWFF
jgi:hypothetical protein